MKVVINRCFGGFGLSVAAARALYRDGMAELGRPVDEYFGPQRVDAKYGLMDCLTEWRKFIAAGSTSASSWSLSCVFSDDESHVISTTPNDALRADPRLVAVVERMGSAANGAYAKLAVVEIPDGIKWAISDYDGMESVEEAHRSWS